MPAARYAARYLGNDLHVDFTVRVAVSAASKYSGATTVQVYARRIAERAPLRQLVALQKTRLLTPGSHQDVTFVLDAKNPIDNAFCPFCHFDDETGTRLAPAAGETFELTVSLGKGIEAILSSTIRAD